MRACGDDAAVAGGADDEYDDGDRYDDSEVVSLSKPMIMRRWPGG